MRLPALTRRGLGVIAAGLAALVASRGFGTPALTTLGVGLLALPAIAAVLAGVAVAGLRLRREVAPEPARVGEPLRVELGVEGWPVRTGLVRLLELRLDPAAPALGPARSERGGGRAGGAWRVLLPRRGEHHLDPATLAVLDPLGLARAERAGAPATVVVLPRAPALAGVAALGRRAAAARGREPDWGELERVRDYRPGDPLSRVHWAQTAKRGRLQTKELRAAASDRAAIGLVFDARAPAATPASTAYEDAVSVAAAVARHTAERGLPLGFGHTGRRAPTIAPHPGSWPAAELALARVGPAGAGAASVLVPRALAAWGTLETLVVVSAAADAGLAGAAARAAAAGVRVAAVLVGPAAASSADALRRGAVAVVVLAPGEDPGSALAGRPAAAAGPPSARAVA